MRLTEQTPAWAEPEDAAPSPTPETAVPPAVAAGRRGRASRSKRPRSIGSRRFKLLAGGLTAFLLLLAVGAGIPAYLGYNALRSVQAQLSATASSGEAHLQAGKADLKLGAAAHDKTKIAAGKAEFEAAYADFASTETLASSNSLINRLASLPFARTYVVPRQRSAIGIAQVGEAVADAGSDASEIDALLAVPDAPGQQGAAKLLAVLDQAAPNIDKLGKDLKAASAGAAMVDPSVLSESQRKSFASARDSVTKGLAALGEFAALVPVIQEVMGANGPRTYLIEQVNPAELRGGGGYLGTYSLLKADHGSLKILKSGDTKVLDNPRPVVGQRDYVAPPGPLQEFISSASWSLRDSNFFASFAANAQAAEQFTPKSLNTPVDGVIALDYYAVQDMLALTGPIQLPEYGVTVSSQNFISTLIQKDQTDTVHTGVLSATAGPLMSRVTELPSNKWTDLLATFNSLASQRHLQAYMNDPNAEAELAKIGWSGELLNAGRADYMMEAESNYGGSKANYYLTRSYRVSLTRNDATLHHQVSVDFVEQLPLQFGRDYRAYVELFVPAGAANLKTSNLKADTIPNATVPSDLKLLDGWLQVNTDPKTKQGKSAITFEYDTPWLSDATGGESLYWQKQPGTGTDKFDITYQVNGQKFTASGDLSVDRLLKLGPAGLTIEAGQAANAKLPNLSL